MDEQELRLVTQAQAGDRQAFGELYDRYCKPVYKFVYFKTFDKALTEDLVSTVFMKALERLHQFSPSPESSFMAWVYQIARTTVIDHYRTQKPTEYMEDGWDTEARINISSDIEHALQVEQAVTYLKTLPPHERDIILLRVWQELSYKEIALIIGKTEKNCKMIFSRSIHKLRTAIPLALYLLLLSHLYD